MKTTSPKETQMTTQNNLKIRRLVPLAVVCCALLAPSLASAAERYATPSPSGTADCSQQDPCSLQTAVEAAKSGDEVIVGAGTYNEGTDRLHASVTNISIHGVAGEQRPQINFGATADAGVLVNGGGTANLRGLAIEYGGSQGGLVVNNSNGVAEQLVVRSTTGGACQINAPSFTLRNSVCATSHENSAGVSTVNFSVGQIRNLVLRNVTAVGAGAPGVGIFVSTSGTSTTTVDAKNVIADGGTGGVSADVFASNRGSAAARADVNLAHSNYDSRCESPAPGSCAGSSGVTVTSPGTPTNQTAAPIFADSDFHQDPSSPTIDQGTVDASVGSTDVDGEPRSMRAAVDIGADELTGPVTPPAQPPINAPDVPAVGEQSDSDAPIDGGPSDTDPPETSIRKGPPNSLQGTTARFRFVSDEAGSTFQCKIDRSAFRSCTSGRRYRRLDEGKHRFLVRATDAAGNADPTAARDTFRVVED